MRSLYVYLHAFAVSGDIIVAQPNIEAARICWLLQRLGAWYRTVNFWIPKPNMSLTALLDGSFGLLLCGSPLHR